MKIYYSTLATQHSKMQPLPIPYCAKVLKHNSKYLIYCCLIKSVSNSNKLNSFYQLFSLEFLTLILLCLFFAQWEFPFGKTTCYLSRKQTTKATTDKTDKLQGLALCSDCMQNVTNDNLVHYSRDTVKCSHCLHHTVQKY